MSTEPEITHRRASIQLMMRRLDGFARGLGLSETATRQVVEQVLADMPGHDSDELLIEARHRMIMATV